MGRQAAGAGEPQGELSALVLLRTQEPSACNGSKKCTGPLLAQGNSIAISLPNKE